MDDPLTANLLDLLAVLREHSIPLTIGGGFGLYLKRKQASGSTTAAASKTPSFTQAQEVQDFQIFSSLTSQQQASDLNFLGTVAGLFGGGAGVSR